MAGFCSRCRLAPAPNATGTVADRKTSRAEYLINKPPVDQCIALANSRELFRRSRHYSYRRPVLIMISDEALMLEFQGGSREAFEELFARYREPLFGFFRRRLESKERADDLTQETFLAVIRATSRYQPRALVRTYLYGIALKLLAAERRRERRSDPTPQTDAVDARSEE